MSYAKLRPGETTDQQKSRLAAQREYYRKRMQNPEARAARRKTAREHYLENRSELLAYQKTKDVRDWRAMRMFGITADEVNSLRLLPSDSTRAAQLVVISVDR